MNVVQELRKSLSEISKKMVVLEASTQQAAAALSLAAPATRGGAKSLVATAAGAATEESMVDVKGLGRPPIFDARKVRWHHISAVGKEGPNLDGFSEALC